MNEVNAKLLQVVIIFWFLLGLFSFVFANRIGSYFVSTAEVTDFNSDAITILWNIASFQVTEVVPVWISVILDIVAVLTIIAIVMAITNR